MRRVTSSERRSSHRMHHIFDADHIVAIGSTIGNSSRPERGRCRLVLVPARAFLDRVRSVLAAGVRSLTGRSLVSGIDLQQTADRIGRARLRVFLGPIGFINLVYSSASSSYFYGCDAAILTRRAWRNISTSVD